MLFQGGDAAGAATPPGAAATPPGPEALAMEDSIQSLPLLIDEKTSTAAANSAAADASGGEGTVEVKGWSLEDEDSEGEDGPSPEAAEGGTMADMAGGSSEPGACPLQHQCNSQCASQGQCALLSSTEKREA